MKKDQTENLYALLFDGKGFCNICSSSYVKRERCATMEEKQFHAKAHADAGAEIDLNDTGTFVPMKSVFA